MSDVFISYSRLDKDFVAQLREALAIKKQQIWIDWESIPPSQAWWGEIQKGIARANNFVLILSPHSMASPICQMEIEYARQLKKRIIPVYHADYDRETCLIDITKRLSKKEETTTREIWGTRQAYDLYDANDGELKHINYFFFTTDADFDARFEDLFAIIRTDYAHKEQHTTLELRALEWDRRAQDASFLLLDNELMQAQAWLKNAKGKEPAPTDLHRAYIQASEKRTRQLKTIRRASIIGSAVAGIAIVFATVAVLVGVQANTKANEAELREANANTQVAHANTQVAVVAVTVTQAAVVQQITRGFTNIMFQNKDDPDAQIVAMSALVNQYPNQSVVYLNRGLLYADQGHYDKAIADYTYALELNPDYARAYNNRGIAYRALERYDDAIADYTRALEIDPQYALAYYNRGNIFNALARYESAIADYSRAIEIDPQFTLAYNNRGTIFGDLKRYADAVADWRTAEQLGYELPPEVVTLMAQLLASSTPTSTPGS